MEEDIPIPVILLDILRGYSPLTKKGKTLFFKHFTYLENLALDEYEREQLEYAKIKGIKTEQQLIEEAISKKYWDLKSEEKISSLKWVISKTEASIEKVSDNNQKRVFQASISKQKKELGDLQNGRDKLIEYSAESFALGKRNVKLIQEAFFYDKNLTKNVEEKDYSDYLPLLQSRLSSLSKEDNLIKASYQASFFDLYSLSSKDPLKLIQRDVFDITILQKNLLVYASILLNKLKNLSVPDEVRKDPMRLIKFKKEDNSEGKNQTEGVEDIRKKMAKRGGNLKAEDLLS